METTKSSFTPKELVYKHIYDPNHVVTEEEFRNMIVGVREDKPSYDGLSKTSTIIVKQKEEFMID